MSGKLVVAKDNMIDLKAVKNFGKVMSSFKKLFLEVCKYVYISLEKDKNFKVNLIEYLAGEKNEYNKILKSTGSLLNLNSNFDRYSDEFHK